MTYGTLISFSIVWLIRALIDFFKAGKYPKGSKHKKMHIFSGISWCFLFLMYVGYLVLKLRIQWIREAETVLFEAVSIYDILWFGITLSGACVMGWNNRKKWKECQEESPGADILSGS